MPWIVTRRTLTPYTSLDGGFCTMWSFVAKGLFERSWHTFSLVGRNDSRPFHWNRTCTFRETLAIERFHVTWSLSKIQTWRGTKVFILIRHKRRYIPGGGYSIYTWVGRCGAAPHTLTLFKTNIADFPTLFKTEFWFFNTRPCVRHLTRILITKRL